MARGDKSINVMGVELRTSGLAASERGLAASERGLASIIVTTVLISVLGLILVGFSLTARRNQRETLDRQLSTQAYYAAETAVNKVAASAIKQYNSGAGTVTDIDNCGSSPDVSDVPGVEATCVTLDASLEVMRYDGVSDGEDTFVPVIPTSATAEGTSIEVTWYPGEGENPQTNCPGNSADLPARADWPSDCKYGVLRVDMTAKDGANFNPDALATTAFIKPSSSSIGAPSFDFNQMGAQYVTWANCDATSCKATINIPDPAAGKEYYLRLRSIYHNASVEVRLQNGATTVPTKGQVSIDATAKAQDVLRRIQVRLSLMPGNPLASLGAIESTGSVCKRGVYAPGYSSFDTANCPAP